MTTRSWRFATGAAVLSGALIVSACSSSNGSTSQTDSGGPSNVAKFDGTIKIIMPQGLVVIQEVNDPLSLVKQREIRKLLRSLEDAKE